MARMACRVSAPPWRCEASAGVLCGPLERLGQRCHRVHAQDKTGTFVVNLRSLGTCTICAVFDGHGGVNAAEYAEQNFAEVFRTVLDVEDVNVPEALTTAFHKLDKDFISGFVCAARPHRSRSWANSALPRALAERC